MADGMELVDLSPESFTPASEQASSTRSGSREQPESDEPPPQDYVTDGGASESADEFFAAVEGSEGAADEAGLAGPPQQANESRDQPARSMRTRTELPEPSTPTFEAADGDGTADFPVRRAVSDWALADRSHSTAHIRSERIRRTAQLFEDLAQEQEERQATLTARRGGRRRLATPAPASAAVTLPPEREVLLVLLPSPPPQPPQSRQVDAILALGSGGGGTRGDSDAEGDERDEEALWEKVRAKIAARRDKFRRLESRQDEPELRSPRKAAPASTHRLSAERTSWLVNGKPAAPSPSAQDIAALKQQKQGVSSCRQEMGQRKETAAPQSKQQVAAPKQPKMAALSSQRAAEPSKEVPPKQQANGRGDQKMAAPKRSALKNGRTEATRSSYGKYIEQQEEQQVLRSLGSSVLARQRLSTKEKAREQLINQKTEAERRQKKAENQRADAQSRLQKTKGRLTRDSAFERKGLENLISRLDGTIREETRKINKLSGQIDDADAEIEDLRRRAAA